MPLLVSALARNASTQQGAADLAGALARDHDGSVLGDIGGLARDYQSGPGEAILGHILGGQSQPIEAGISQGTGVDGGALLKILAPIVLGALGQSQPSGGFNPSDLASVLGGDQSAAAQSNPDLFSTLNTLLDTNRSGSAIDEVTGFLGGLFQRKT